MGTKYIKSSITNHNRILSVMHSIFEVAMQSVFPEFCNASKTFSND